MKSISIRNVPDPVYEKLQGLARKNRRSLQEQIKVILEEEIQLSNPSFLSDAAEWRKRLQGRQLRDSVEMVREDRIR